jgi:hypothetical protein
MATITSVIGLYEDFVSTGVLKYLATYRLSQDHIELTFNVVRSRGRWNNNPTANQFQAAYRRLLMKHDIKPSETGNAVSQESFEVLPSIGVVPSRESVVSSTEILQRCGLNVDSCLSDHDYSITADKINLSEFSNNIVVYIAGFVARKLLSKLHCVPCKASLLCSTNVVENSKLIQRKDNGGLLFPSKSVVTVCAVTERCIRHVSGQAGGTVCQQRNTLLALQMAVINRTQHMNLFCISTDEHSCSTDILDSPVLTLVRLVINEYVNVRFHAMAKKLTEKIRGKNVRVNSNKQVLLFAHQ